MSKTEAEILAAYESRCAKLASYASSAGITLKKGPKTEITVSAASGSVVFPIASDPRDWIELKPEAAFYSRMLDVKSWRNVRFEAATNGTSPDAVDVRAELPSFLKEAGAEAERGRALAKLLGGEEKLDALLAHVETS